MLERKKHVSKLVIGIIVLPIMLLAQTENWVYRYDGPGNDWDVGTSIALGADGSIYAAGYSAGSDPGVDLIVISLTTTGDTNWVYRYNGPGNGDDEVRSIVCGADGCIYAGGYSTGNGTNEDCTVISLTTDGDTNWLFRFDGGQTREDVINSLIYGADGNIYAAGYTVYTGGYYCLTVFNLSTTGDTNWVYRYNGPMYRNDAGNSVVYGDDGNIYVGGYSTGASASEDLVVISLTTVGDTNWVYRYDGPANERDVANAVVYGGDGNIYVAGSSWSSGTYEDLITISLTPTGDTNWVFLYDGPGSYEDVAASLVYGADSAVYVAGYSYGEDYTADMIVISLTTSGDTNWVFRYNGPAGERDVANAVVYGGDGNVYVAGSSRSGTSDDLTVVSLTPSGDTNWLYQYNGTGNYEDVAHAMVQDADSAVYIAGASVGSSSSYDFIVVSLPPDLMLAEQENEVVEAYRGVTILSGSLPLPIDSSCRVFDITGREIHTIDPTPGIYFIQIKGKITHKIVKIK